MLRRAIELGIDLIDTADVYGPGLNEQQISAALWPYPERLVIATKAGLTRGRGHELIAKSDPAHLHFGLEGSLLRLKRDHIDLWQITASTRKSRSRNHGHARRSAARGEGAPSRPVRSLGGADRAGRRRGADRHGAESLQPRRSRTRGGGGHCTAHGIGFISWYPVANNDRGGLAAIVRDIAMRGVPAPSR